jgi:hypothetical protein
LLEDWEYLSSTLGWYRVSVGQQHDQVRFCLSAKRGLGTVLVTFMVTQNLVSIVIRQFNRVKARFA